MAAVVPRSSNTGNSTASNTVLVTKPAGLAVGDVMIAPLAIDRSGSTVLADTPAGWTSLGSFSNSSANLICFWKVATSADLALSSFTFNCSGTGTAVSMEAGVAAWSVNDPVSPIDQQITANAASVAGITPTVAMGQFVMAVAAFNSAAGSGSVAGYAITNNNPAWTEVFDAGVAASSRQSGVALAYANSTRLAATGTASATLTGYDTAKLFLLNIVPAAIPSIATTPAMPSPSLPHTVSPFSAALTMPVPVASSLTPKWPTLPKSSTASVVNLPKS